VKEPIVADSNKDAPTVAEVTSPITTELADFIKAQRDEYGKYVAKEKIYVGTALAYNAGDAVPISNAERLGYVDAGVVVKVGTKEHAELLKSLGQS
jgi:hypothetical protein